MRTLTPVERNKEEVCGLIAAIETNAHERRVKNFINSIFENDKSYNINSEDSQGRLPLVCACAAKNIEMVNFLIKKGADVNLQSKYGLWPLLRATTIGSVEIVKRLIQVPGIKVDQPNIAGNTPLMVLCKETELSEDDKKIIKILIKAGANPDLENSEGVSARSLKSDLFSTRSSSPKSLRKGGKTNKTRSIKKRKTIRKKSQK